MKQLTATVAACIVLQQVGLLQADVRSTGPGLTSLSTVHVGDLGNAGEWSGESYGGSGPDRICGAVGYGYNIGTYEVTAGQYCEFLNAVARTDTYGLYSPSMADPYTPYVWGCNIQRSGSSGSYVYSVAADWANRPVNYVSWGDAARFANWLYNSQPAGPQDATTTEDGSYDLGGATADLALMNVTRKPEATWVIPSEDEWYKAAYYDPDKAGGAGYWDYPTQSDSTPDNGNPDGDSGNTCNYYDGDYSIGSPYYRTQVGAFARSPSPCGTFDQGGNLWEWNETISSGLDRRGARGGTFYPNYSAIHLLAASRANYGYPSHENCNVGFRLVEVPEPASLLFFVLGGSALLHRRRGRSW